MASYKLTVHMSFSTKRNITADEKDEMLASMQKGIDGITYNVEQALGKAAGVAGIGAVDVAVGRRVAITQ